MTLLTGSNATIAHGPMLCLPSHVTCKETVKTTTYPQFQLQFAYRFSITGVSTNHGEREERGAEEWSLGRGYFFTFLSSIWQVLVHSVSYLLNPKNVHSCVAPRLLACSVSGQVIFPEFRLRAGVPDVHGLVTTLGFHKYTNKNQ